MFGVVTVPVIIGMTIRKFQGDFIEKNMNLIEKISIGLFLIVFIAIYVEEWNNIIMFLTTAGAISLILNISMMIIGFYVAKFFTSGVPQQKCISLECGLQNGTLAVFVGTQIFDDNIIYMVPTAAYALIMMITSVVFVFFIRKRT